MSKVFAEPLAHELDAAWMIALWLAIHGGDPQKEAVDVAAVAGRIIASLSNFAFGTGTEVSAEELRSRLGKLDIQVNRVGKGEARGVQADFIIPPGGANPHGKLTYIPDGQGGYIVIKLPSATKQ